MSTLTFDVSELNGNNGFIIDGVNTADDTGFSVSGEIDINGDGFDDLIIGSPNYGDYSIGPIIPGIPSPITKNNQGATQVVFGTSEGFPRNFNLADLDGNNGLIVDGDPREEDNFGVAVSSAGDVNGDGFGDLIIGADYSDVGDFNTGSTYVVFGNGEGVERIKANELNGENGFVLNGLFRNERLGYSVSGAGDLNGDGFDDLIIGSNSQDFRESPRYVIFGQSGGFDAEFDLSTINGNNGFLLDGAVRSVSNAGDVNGDGFEDIIVGGVGVSTGEVIDSESINQVAYVLFGKSSNFDTNIELTELDGSDGFILTTLGYSYDVSDAGDINGDGLDDLIVSSSESLDSVVYLVFGRNDGTDRIDLFNLDGSNGFTIDGFDRFNFAPRSISNAGDINGDGFDDIVIGTNGGPLGSSNDGQAFVIYGKSQEFEPTLTLPNLESSQGFIINVNESQISVGSAGDINDDGFDDIIIGSPNADGNERISGRSYVVFGFDDSSQPNKITGTSGNDIIDGTVNADQIHALAGNDRVRGLAGNDTINGDAGQDTLFGNNGNDLIDGGDGNDTLWGQADNDSVAGGNGRDRILGNNGNDTLEGGNDIDTLFGGNGNDSVFGNGGNDQVIGNAGDDSLFGGGDNDILFGYAGADELFGEAGNDVLWGQANNDFVSGGAGTDVLYGNNGNDVLVGGDGTDSLFGNADNDFLAGNTGNDILFGNDGSDTLYGGQANDNLWGGTGNDFFELTRGADVGVDRVKDYLDGVDKFLLSDRFGLGSLEFDDLTISQNGNNAQIKITDNNQLLAIVENTNANQLNSNDFVTV